MTSCLTSRSISSMRATSNFAFEPLSQMALAALLGIWPNSAMAAAACASISNQMRKRVSGAQSFAISGRV